MKAEEDATAIFAVLQVHKDHRVKILPLADALLAGNPPGMRQIQIKTAKA